MKIIDEIRQELDGLIKKLEAGKIATRVEILKEFRSTSDELKHEMNLFIIKYKVGEYSSRGEILQELNGIRRKILKRKQFPLFEVNKFITLKLEGAHTIIYVNGERFDQCKRIVIDIPLEDVSQYAEANSIDEVAELHATIYEGRGHEKAVQQYSIAPERNFGATAPNLQAWVENDYNTRLLHSNLAFPLLKKLVDLGEETARKVFRKEIASRLVSGHRPTIDYLLYKGYIEYLQLGDIDEILIGLSRMDKDVDFIIELIQHDYIDKIQDDYFKFNSDKIYQSFVSSNKVEDYNEYHGGTVKWFKDFKKLSDKIQHPPDEKIFKEIYKIFLNKHAVLIFIGLIEACGYIPEEEDIQEAYNHLVSNELQAPFDDYAKKLQEISGVHPSNEILEKIYEPDQDWRPADGYFTNRLYNFFDFHFNRLRFRRLKELLEASIKESEHLERLLRSLVEALFFGWDPLMSYSSNFLDTINTKDDIDFLARYSEEIYSFLLESKKTKELKYFQGKIDDFQSRSF